MSQNVTIFGDIADRYDHLVAYNEKMLGDWVEETGYSTWAMGLASTGIAFEQFAKSFVDIGRLGNGILLEKGWKGPVKDGLRVLNFAGGVGAVAGRVSRVLRVVQASSTATCSWVTATNALRATGQRFFITMDQLANEAGVSIKEIAQSGTGLPGYAAMVSAFQKSGVAYRILQPAGNSLEEAVNLARANGSGAVTFSIIWGARMGHRLYATFSRTAGLAISDTTGEVYRSLSALRAAYPNAVLNASPIIFIKDALIVTASHAAQRASELALLARQVIPILPVLGGDAETAADVLHVKGRVAAHPPSKPEPSVATNPNPISTPSVHLNDRHHTVVQGDWLSKLAEKYYGSARKWPVIYEANRQTIGRNPDRIVPGQRLVIPSLPTGAVGAR
jgi:nucleoid-associated protein YgaU